MRPGGENNPLVTELQLQYLISSIAVSVLQLECSSYVVTVLVFQGYSCSATIRVFHLQYFTYSITVRVLQLQCHSTISYNVTFIMLQKVLQYYIVGRVIVSSFMRVEQEGERLVLLARPLGGAWITNGLTLLF